MMRIEEREEKEKGRPTVVRGYGRRNGKDEEGERSEYEDGSYLMPRL